MPGVRHSSGAGARWPWKVLVLRGTCHVTLRSLPKSVIEPAEILVVLPVFVWTVSVRPNKIVSLVRSGPELGCWAGMAVLRGMQAGTRSTGRLPSPQPVLDLPALKADVSLNSPARMRWGESSSLQGRSVARSERQNHSTTASTFTCSEVK